jgi:hypothetical protein
MTEGILMLPGAVLSASFVEFQKASGRRVAKLIKKSRKGREGLATLAGFGLPIPEDFAALYDHFDGITASARLSFWETTVFLDAFWPESAMLVSSNKIARLEKHFAAERKIRAFLTTHGVSYDLFPDLAQKGVVPLVANLGPLSQRSFIAFDSTLAMLRSVCAAQDAGVLRFAPDRVAHFPAFGRGVEKDEIVFDPKDLWEVIRAFNARAEYWALLAEGRSIGRRSPTNCRRTAGCSWTRKCARSYWAKSNPSRDARFVPLRRFISTSD